MKHYLVNKAVRKTKAMLPWSLLTLVPFMMGSCSEYEGDPESYQTVPLTFYLQATGEQTTTRAYEGGVANLDGEGTIHSLQIWLFDSTDKNVLVAYTSTYADDGTDGLKSNNDLKKVTLDIPKYIITQKRNVDLYAIANAESAGLSLPQTATVDALDGALMSGDYFKPTYVGTTMDFTTSIPATGLPYAYVEKNWNILNEAQTDLRTDLETVRMTRAVSKIRFAFARSNDMEGVEVTGIQIDGNMIPNSQKLFPVDKATSAASYEGDYWGDLLPNITTADGYFESAMVWGSSSTTSTTIAPLLTTAQLAKFEHPENMTWENYTFTSTDAKERAQEYDNFITSQVTSVNTKDYRTYLRESDKAVTGRIYYRFNQLNTDGSVKAYGTPLVKEFTLAAAGDFVRNHSAIVYCYFKEYRLEVKPIVQKWDWEADNQLDFASKGPIEIGIFGDAGNQSYKVYNPTPLSGEYPANINWNNAYVGIYYGIMEDQDEEQLIGQPLYSPMLHLRTTFSDDLTLYSSNPDFGFVTVTIDEHGHRTYNPTHRNGDNTPLTSVTIPKSTDGETITNTYFFVVPKTQLADIADPNNMVDYRATRLYLLDENNYKQPINPSFMPGPNNVEIWFYYMNSLAAYHDLHDYEN